MAASSSVVANRAFTSNIMHQLPEVVSNAIIPAHVDVIPRIMEERLSLAVLPTRARAGQSGAGTGQTGVAGHRCSECLSGKTRPGDARYGCTCRLRRLDTVSRAHARDRHPDHPATFGLFPPCRS